jgi:hypothetical protein
VWICRDRFGYVDQCGCVESGIYRDEYELRYDKGIYIGGYIWIYKKYTWMYRDGCGYVETNVDILR